MNKEGIKIGKLLCDEDIITKRQLNKALQAQIKGDKRTLGEILVGLGFCDFDDITEVILNSQEETTQHEEKHEEIHNEPIKSAPAPEPTPPTPEPTPPVPQPTPQPEPVVEDEPIELSEDKVLGTKFTMSMQRSINMSTTRQ